MKEKQKQKQKGKERRRGIKKPHPKDRVLKIDKNRSFSYLPMKSETFNSLTS